MRCTDVNMRTSSMFADQLASSALLYCRRLLTFLFMQMMHILCGSTNNSQQQLLLRHITTSCKADYIYGPFALSCQHAFLLFFSSSLGLWVCEEEGGG